MSLPLTADICIVHEQPAVSERRFHRWRLAQFVSDEDMQMTLDERIEQFLAGSPHAVVGASRDRAKYGNKVLRVYLQNQRPVFAVNPNAQTVEGFKCYPDLASLPEKVHGISIVTPPHVTEEIVEQAGKLGIENVWMQPGAESERAVARAEELGMNVIAGGPCALVVMGYRESDSQ